jgi:hypothetical protein
LIDFQEACRAGNTAWIGQQPTIDKIARNARKKWTLVFLLDLRPGTFEQLPVLHARGASGLTVAAVQAAVDMQDKRIAKLKPPPIDKLHLSNTPPR